MLAWREDSSSLVRAITDREGGLGVAPYQSFNLGMHVGDDPGIVQANRAALEAELGLPIVYADQVHGSQVLEVTASTLTAARTETGAIGVGDALFTELAGIGLAILVADCTPVVIHDEAGRFIGAAHAGRPGLVAGVVPALVARMREAGASGLRALVGPSVCGRCYEVPPAMRREVGEAAAVSATVSWTGTPAVDVAAGVVSGLTELEVPVQWIPGCTREDSRWFSHRRDGRTGRFAAIVGRPA